MHTSHELPFEATRGIVRGAFEMHGLRGADRGDAAGSDAEIPRAAGPDEERRPPTLERKRSRGLRGADRGDAAGAEAERNKACS